MRRGLAAPVILPLFPDDRVAVGALRLRRFDLERQPTSHLQDALGARRRGDLAIVARREACSGVWEAHQVEDIGGLAAELEDHSMLEVDVFEDT